MRGPAACSLCLLSLLTLATSSPLTPRATSTSNGFADPTNGGGSWLTNANDGFGEPINVVVSGNSDVQVLDPQGFYNYALSLEFGTECLGEHLGGYQSANLGDGNGQHNQTGIYRENFGNQQYGTCQESVDGGNHFRFWRQNGSSADTGAWFMAVSIEKNLTYGHMIESNGYDLGRDSLVSRANSSSGTSNAGVTYKTSVQMVSGLLTAGSNGINHGISIDGLVAVLTVSASGNMQSNTTATAQSSNSEGTTSTAGKTGGASLAASLPVSLALLATAATFVIAL